MGDGTTSVVICAAELLKRANELVRNKIHPTSIISGYRLAMREVGTCMQAAHTHSYNGQPDRNKSASAARLEGLLLTDQAHRMY